MDLEETRRLALLLITKAVRYDDCWKSMFWAILCTTPLTGNISRNTRVKYLKMKKNLKLKLKKMKMRNLIELWQSYMKIWQN